VARDDTGLLVVTGSVASQLKDLSSEVLEDGSEVDGSTGTDTLSVVALAEKTVDTTDGESEASLGRTTVRLSEMMQCERVLDAIFAAKDASSNCKDRPKNAKCIRDCK